MLTIRMPKEWDGTATQCRINGKEEIITMDGDTLVYGANRCQILFVDDDTYYCRSHGETHQMTILIPVA